MSSDTPYKIPLNKRYIVMRRHAVATELGWWVRPEDSHFPQTVAQVGIPATVRARQPGGWKEQFAAMDSSELSREAHKREKDQCRMRDEATRMLSQQALQHRADTLDVAYRETKRHLADSLRNKSSEGQV